MKPFTVIMNHNNIHIHERYMQQFQTDGTTPASFEETLKVAC